MSIKDFENKRWNKGDQKRVFRHDAALSLIDGGTVLDLGCGDGLLLGLLRDKGVSGEGLDISPVSVEMCLRKGIKATVHSFDDPLPYENASFDTVILLDVLEHVYDPVPLLKEAVRVSRDGVIVGVPNFSSFPARLQTLFGRVPENNQPHKGHIYWFNYNVLCNLAKKTGVTISMFKANTFRPFSKLLPAVIRMMPNLFALSFVVFLKKGINDSD